MADLSIITDAIENKAKADAAEILKQAELKFTEAVLNAKKEAEKEAQEILEIAKEQVKSIEQTAKSAAEGKLLRELLKKKSELIDDAIKKTKERIYSMNDTEYNALLEKLLKKYAVPGKSGEIIFSDEDKNRILTSLKDEIKILGLTISDEKADFKGGFILRYGKIEENCSIEAIFHNRYEEITDFLNNRLFG